MYYAHLSVSNPEVLDYFRGKEGEKDYSWGGVLITDVQPTAVSFRTCDIPEAKLLQLSKQYPEEELNFMIRGDCFHEEYSIKGGKAHVEVSAFIGY